MKTLYLAALFVLVFGTAWAGPPASYPPPPEESMPALAAPIRFFQRYLSGADGHRCPMTPSCSSYALQAVQRHGSIKGWIMASDRLMRCGRDELKLSPSVMTRNGIRCQDPLDNNDVWRH
ncbi:MAG: membrane protein insertion efficiency factor YidD [Desulfosarcina sp.]|nr:membrane protein insertion efficiency factor YidD [Desulfosarcina sp.]